MKTVVIGGGVLGASVAYRLARAGAQVTVLERERVGAGASGATFAWTNSLRKPPRPYHDLNVASMAMYRRLGEQFEETSWFRVTGNAEWAVSEEARQEQKDRIRRLHAWGYRAEWIGIDDLVELEPDLDRDAVGDAQIAYYPDDGLVDPVRFATTMLAAATRRHGAELRLGVRATQVDIRSGRIAAVLTADGDRHEADVFVNCAGRWVNDVVGNAPDLSIPMAPTTGFLAFTPPAPTTVTRPLHTPGVNIRPDGAGRLMMASAKTDTQSSLEAPAGISSPPAMHLMAETARLMPALAGMKPEATRTTLRSIPLDDVAVLGRFPHVENYYLCVTHSGVTLAPLLGKLVMEEVALGKATMNLEPFRPTRFAAGGTS